MDNATATGNVAQSLEAVNQILQTANKETMEMAEKLVKVALELSTGKALGLGSEIDVSG